MFSEGQLALPPLQQWTPIKPDYLMSQNSLIIHYLLQQQSSNCLCSDLGGGVLVYASHELSKTSFIYLVD